MAAASPSLFRRLQLASGLASGLFLALHVLTVAALVVDPDAFDQALFGVRQLYRPSELVEALVVWTPLTLHLLASWAVAVERRGLAEHPTRSVAWLRRSGRALLVLLGVHVLVARLLPALEGYAASASYLAFAVENWPWVAAYYLILALSGAFHAGMGAAVALSGLGMLRAGARTVTGLTWSAILALALVAGMGRVVLDAPDMDPSFYSSYQRLYERYLPFLQAKNPRVR